MSPAKLKEKKNKLNKNDGIILKKKNLFIENTKTITYCGRYLTENIENRLYLIQGVLNRVDRYLEIEKMHEWKK